MNVKNFVKAELEHFRMNCNFVGYEMELFNRRAEGYTLEEIAEMMNISSDYARKLSVKVNRKIKKVMDSMA